jgi:hypothetical protein
MRKFQVLGLSILLFAAARFATAQDEKVSPVATLQLADGTSVALLDWKLTYEYLAWRSKDPVSSAKPSFKPNTNLVLGKKSIPVKGDTLSLTYVEGDDMVRVSAMSLKKAGDVKVEQPARDVIAPDLDKNYIYQPRSLDISGSTLSGIERSFCVASFHALVECGGTKTTRVVKIEFN